MQLTDDYYPIPHRSRKLILDVWRACESMPDTRLGKALKRIPLCVE